MTAAKILDTSGDDGSFFQHSASDSL